MAKTILLVDDSATMLMSIKLTLEMSGFKVEIASNGLRALDMLNSGIKPDLIIADILMPSMDGLEFIKRVKALQAFRFTPILALTVVSDPSKRDEGRKLGVAGWLVKPISGPDLVKAVEQLLQGREESHAK